MSPGVVVIADAGEGVGLGHLSRSTAVAVALESRGVRVWPLAHGASAPLSRGHLVWTPLEALDGLRPTAPDVLVVDSYLINAAEAAERVRPRVLLVFDDGEQPVPPDAIAVRPAAPVDDSRSELELSGLEYVCLGPAYWGVPLRQIGRDVRRVLVTVGGGRGAASLGPEVAAAAAEALPDSEVRLVRSAAEPPGSAAGIQVVAAPDDLLDELVAADLVLCAGGQTMLETAAVGTPCVALVIAPNQRVQAQELADREAVCLIDPPDPREVEQVLRALAGDQERRSRMSRAGQSSIDGFGALRVAFAITRPVGVQR